MLNIATQKFSSRFQCLLILFFLVPPFVYAGTYEEGKQAYLDKDYSRAFEILKPLAEQGNSQAQITIGLMFDYGHGVPANPELAIKWYTLAAQQGVPVVQHDLGVKYFQGQGVAQNYIEAAKWWEMSATAGLADSQFNLGLMHYRGIGISRDLDKATKLFRAAADQGHGNAQYSLAVMHAFGQGMEKNYSIAHELFNKSADQGVAQAQFNLGVFYENGFGVDKDLNKAKQWYQLAANQGLKEAMDKLQTIENQSQQPAEAVTEMTTSLSVSKPHLEVSNELNKSDWLRQQQPDNYTIQLGSVVIEQDMLAYIKENELAPMGGYIEVIVNDTPRYTAIYGLFNTYREAEQAINDLPDHIQSDNPWVRNTGILQKTLK